MKLRALPRGTRRALQRKLARARELVALQPEWQRKLAGSLAGAALLLALAQSASAATITVTTNIPDINDGDGQCSLIEAIVNANDDAATHPDCPAGSGADTIVLPAGTTHALTSGPFAYNGLAGLPTITSEITISGNQSEITRVAGSPAFRIISVSPAGILNAQDLTVSGGSEKFGGGIFNKGTLSLSASVITGHQGMAGGGIYNGGVTILDRVILYSNLAAQTLYGHGGAIDNNRGTLVINNTTISNNTAGGTDVNRAFGGGINSRSGYLSFTNSTIAGNTAFAGKTIIHGSDPQTVTPPWDSGGGIRSYADTIVIQNSTFSGNRASDGGGIRSVQSEVTIGDTTFSNNIANWEGGGILSSGNASMTITRSIVSGNQALLFQRGAEFLRLGPLVEEFNLFGQNGDPSVAYFTPDLTDIIPAGGITTKKILGPLKDNGGPALTHALVKGSPALDAAPVDANCPATDQRGIARPQGSACDIGAVEGVGREEPPPQPSGHNFVVSSVKAPSSMKHGGGIAPVAVTIRNASDHSETLNGPSVLGDGASTGLVRLAIEVIDSDGEQCQPAAVALDGSKKGKLFSKGAKALAAGASLTVNFLVTYRCEAPMNKRNPEAGDFSNSASVYPGELDGISDSNATSTLAGAATKVTP
ncbi:MAG TPA: right-handed parallel beta-helix repeat-containing protein [Candidatus Binatia bacterium]